MSELIEKNGDFVARVIASATHKGFLDERDVDRIIARSFALLLHSGLTVEKRAQVISNSTGNARKIYELFEEMLKEEE